MKCTRCGEDTKRPFFQSVFIPASAEYVKGPPRMVNTKASARWACDHCGRFHFADGTAYDYEEAKRLARS